jgi:hydroxymethylbilane synthase
LLYFYQNNCYCSKRLFKASYNPDMCELTVPPKQHIRIGTRGSTLALAQAHEVRQRLLNAHPQCDAGMIDIVPIKTTGDRILDRNLAEIGGKGLFTKEIEEALLDGSIDIAVHSMKDMPPHVPDGLGIACILPREDPRDAFISLRFPSISALPQGAIIGTSSSRRQAQLLHLRPDLTVIPFRGNVMRRLEKLEGGMADAIILAVAGLNRINQQQHITAILSPEQMLPAVAQGAIGIECRNNDHNILELLSAIHHPQTSVRIQAERAFLTVLEGSCRTPIAAFAELSGEQLHLRTLIATTDGSIIHSTERHGNASDAAQMGHDAGLELKARGGANFFY